jgi:hypothetical protein
MVTTNFDDPLFIVLKSGGDDQPYKHAQGSEGDHRGEFEGDSDSQHDVAERHDRVRLADNAVHCQGAERHQVAPPRGRRAVHTHPQQEARDHDRTRERILTHRPSEP